jgi:hypothetical protein
MVIHEVDACIRNVIAHLLKTQGLSQYLYALRLRDLWASPDWRGFVLNDAQPMLTDSIDNIASP